MSLSCSKQALASVAAISASPDNDGARTPLEGVNDTDDLDPSASEPDGGDGPRKDEIRPIKSVPSPCDDIILACVCPERQRPTQCLALDSMDYLRNL